MKVTPYPAASANTAGSAAAYEPSVDPIWLAMSLTTAVHVAVDTSGGSLEASWADQSIGLGSALVTADAE